jgi:branched-subunit amino acid transport protein
MTIDEFLMIVGMVCVTFGIRYVLFAFSDRIELRGLLGRTLNYIPPAVLTAITLPALLLPEGEWFISLQNPYLLAGIAATAAGIVRKNLLVTIATGLLVFLAFRFLQ